MGFAMYFSSSAFTAITTQFRYMRASTGRITFALRVTFDLHTFNNAVVAFRAGAECLKPLLVSVAL
jgi:hypothetical protein